MVVTFLNYLQERIFTYFVEDHILEDFTRLKFRGFFGEIWGPKVLQDLSENTLITIVIKFVCIWTKMSNAGAILQ